MTISEDEPIKTLEQVAEATAFMGFREEEFAIFDIPTFEQRMACLREQVKPKLMLLAQALPERLSAVVGEPLYAHVAQHLRRSVNPPEHTWVAFARAQRAYKPYVHLRVSLSVEGVRLLVFVEDYAEDKAAFAANLARNAEALAAYFQHHPAIHSYDLQDENGHFRCGHQLDAATISDFAARMDRVKGQHARLGISFARTNPLLQNGPEFMDAVVADAARLKPLYDCYRPDFVYTYIPEEVKGL